MTTALMRADRERRMRVERERRESRERLVYCLEDYARKVGAIHELHAEEFADEMIANGWTDE
jgi:hypothetical protein